MWAVIKLAVCANKLKRDGCRNAIKINKFGWGRNTSISFCFVRPISVIQYGLQWICVQFIHICYVFDELVSFFCAECKHFFVASMQRLNALTEAIMTEGIFATTEWNSPDSDISECLLLITTLEITTITSQTANFM